MATYADEADIARWESRPQPTVQEQARINERHRAQREDEARRIGALTERVILGAPGGAKGTAAWAREVRAELDRFRVAGSLRAYDGGADVLVVLQRLIERKEASAAALLAEGG